MFQLNNYKLSILFPFILIFLSEIMHFAYNSESTIIKLIAMIYMAIYSFLKLKFNTKLVFWFLIFLPFLIYHIYISFNINAALEEAIRYLFPINILFFSYAIRKEYKMIFTFILTFSIIGNIYQLVNYYHWMMNVPSQWFYYKVETTGAYYYNSTLGIIRGVGLMGFFGLYGFFNLISFFLAKEFYHGKYKKAMMVVFLIGLFSSLSFKAIGVFFLLSFILNKQKIKIIAIFATVLFLFPFFFPKKSIDIVDQISLRIKLYVTEGGSARSDSYRVMFEDISNFNILGRGVGSFGGAASTKYDSPTYDQVHFNWYDTPFLATTDTYFPHLFVELGLIGGFSYLIILLTPILRKRYKIDILILLLAIYGSLFFDSLFSFALNNLGYLIVSLVLIYPVLEYEKNIINR